MKGMSTHDKGIYKFVSDLGSIACRLVFQPIEEACRIYFSAKEASVKKKQKEDENNQAIKIGSSKSKLKRRKEQEPVQKQVEIEPPHRYLTILGVLFKLYFIGSILVLSFGVNLYAYSILACLFIHSYAAVSKVFERVCHCTDSLLYLHSIVTIKFND